MIARPTYIEELKKWQNKDVIKVITGMRRCGKSTLFDLFIEELKLQGIKDNQIIHINLPLFLNSSILNDHSHSFQHQYYFLYPAQ